ncbi:MAG: gamma-glutamyl-gamma-aminobutyrate hydrolase family protein [Acidimicrobiales bacterium]
MRRPLIAVTGRRLAVGRVERWLEAAVASPALYVEAVARAGGLGVVLAPEVLDADGAGVVVASFDGLLLTGGIDVDPGLYGQARVPETYGCDPAADAFELALLEAALAGGVPTLAICRGLQLLNVARGGTLRQHITGQPGLVPHGIPNGGGGSLVEVTVGAGSRLEGVVGATAVGFCHHHQAVERLGRGLRVVARASDGVIEAIEPVDVAGFALAVQWHPEDTAGRDPDQQRLFDTFVGEAAAAPQGMGRLKKVR